MTSKKRCTTPTLCDPACTHVYICRSPARHKPLVSVSLDFSLDFSPGYREIVVVDVSRRIEVCDHPYPLQPHLLTLENFPKRERVCPCDYDAACWSCRLEARIVRGVGFHRSRRLWGVGRCAVYDGHDVNTGGAVTKHGLSVFLGEFLRCHVCCHRHYRRRCQCRCRLSGLSFCRPW